MKKVIRTGIFETNSSSVHTLVLRGGAGTYDGSLGKPGDVHTLSFGEYGWGYDKLASAADKLSYLITSFQYQVPTVSELHAECGDKLADAQIAAAFEASQHWRWLKEAVADFTGGVQLELPDALRDYYAMGYVDHQSTDLLAELFAADEAEFKRQVIEIVFGKATIVIDNDNH